MSRKSDNEQRQSEPLENMIQRLMRQPVGTKWQAYPPQRADLATVQKLAEMLATPGIKLEAVEAGDEVVLEMERKEHPGWWRVPVVPVFYETSLKTD